MPIESFSNGLPTLPGGACIYGVRFMSCRAGKMTLYVETLLDNEALDGAVPADAWWRIVAPQLPCRVVRLWGARALDRLLTRYGLMDATGCVNSGAGWVSYVDRIETLRAHLAPRPPHPLCAILGEQMGIPQRLENSGICWFASVCFILLLNERIRAHVLAHLPTDLVALARASLADPRAAEAFRLALWNRYAFGDAPDTPPELEGQNGARQICILAAQIGMPIRRIFVDDAGVRHPIRDRVEDMRGGMHTLQSEAIDGKAHITMVRFRRGAHGCNPRHRPTRRLYTQRYRNGVATTERRIYRLVGMLIGSEHCGHQIAAATPTDSWRHWSVCDADARRYGIGPVCWTVEGDGGEVVAHGQHRWWHVFRSMIPVTFFSKGYCDLSPHNRPVDELQRAQTRPASTNQETQTCGRGKTNVDMIYVC